MYTFEPLIAVTSVLDYFIAYALRVAKKPLYIICWVVTHTVAAVVGVL